jgi:hypothetical protein
MAAVQEAKVALSPRGIGRSMFTMFSVIQVGVIPLYIWDGEYRCISGMVSTAVYLGW